MPTLRLLDSYHRHQARLQLMLYLPSPAAADEQMQVLDVASDKTAMPFNEIAGPYIELVKAGYPLSAEHLLQLLQWSERLLIRFDEFVQYYVLPFALKDGQCLTCQLTQMFFKQAA
jgi:hypothetical protein